MKLVKIHQAKNNFSKLIAAYAAGIPRKFGSLKGAIHIAPDFDEIPAGFEEYTD